MPGLEVLREYDGALQVTYSNHRRGGRIRFRTTSFRILTPCTSGSARRSATTARTPRPARGTTTATDRLPIATARRGYEPPRLRSCSAAIVDAVSSSRATTTLPALAAQAGALARRLPDVAAVWGAGRLDPKLREEVMLAVARANACRWCTLAHRQWALAEGVTDAELAALEDQRPEAFDRPTWAAIAWAQARAHADLGPVDVELERELARHYDAAQRADLDLVVRGMTLANVSANTFDALLARLRGRPVRGSRLLDEVVIGTGVALSIPPVAGYLALVQRRPPRRLLRDLRMLRGGHGSAA